MPLGQGKILKRAPIHIGSGTHTHTSRPHVLYPKTRAPGPGRKCAISSVKVTVIMLSAEVDFKADDCSDNRNDNLIMYQLRLYDLH